jgi:hypothetical protein
MALTARSLFLYGLEITDDNSSLDFRYPSGGTLYAATLRTGYYSLNGLWTEVVRAMVEVLPAFVGAFSINRTIALGTENRTTLTSASGTFDLMFGTGPRSTTSCAAILGFNAANYTGANNYTTAATAGTALITEREGYSYLGTDFIRRVQGQVNISASGEKEAVIFQVQRFWQTEFKFEPEAKVMTEWTPMMEWLIQQREFEFTPEISVPNTVYEGTLEKTDADSKGLGFELKEMLPDFPFYYRTGMMQFRLKQT